MKPEAQADKATIPADVLMNLGQTITVKNHKGEDIEVKVRLVPIRELSKYLDVVSSLPDFIQFVTGKDAAFVDTLSDDACYEIDRLGRLFNEPRLEPFLARQRELLNRVAEITTNVRKAIASAISSQTQ